jgi:hypothetical protein
MWLELFLVNFVFIKFLFGSTTLSLVGASVAATISILRMELQAAVIVDALQ